MTNFYCNLNQIQSNPDGEPTVSRQSRLTSNSGETNKKEQLSRDCLSLASELPLRCLRPDTVSFACRCRVLDTLRYISAGLSTRVWKHVAMIFAVLVMSMANIGMAWGTTATYVPLGLKTISTDEVVYCTAITAAGDPTTSWVVVPNYGTSSKGYTQITSTTDNGNPQGITDNLASTKSNVAMIQIKKDGNTYSSSKRVIHMHVKGITGVIAHGNTGSANYGLSIAVAEFNNNLSTFPSDITSGVRKSNGGCVLIKKDGLDASKEYIVSIYSSGGDIYFYAVEFIAGGGGSTTYSVTYDGNGKTSGSVPTDSNSPYEENDEVTVLGNTGTLVKTNYTFTGWNTAADGSGTHYDADDTFTMGTSNVTLYAEWQYSFTTHSPGTYTAAVGSGGYGKTLKTVSSRDYEVYLFSASSSKGTLYAGSASSITDGKALFSGVAANAEGVASDGWLIAKASTYAGSGSTNVNEFSGSSGALTTHYAGITSAQSIKMKISGYDQFSMIGRDGSTTSGKGKFIVKVDGVSQSITATTTDNNVYRFDISTGTHIIEITADGTDNVSRFRGFSLRIPAAACVAPTSVTVAPTSEAGNYGYRYTIGETLKLTATPTGGTGTPSYQWQKYVGSDWENITDGGTVSGATTANLQISNLTSANGGSYRCTVSTGATCSTSSGGYQVYIFTLDGNYYGSAWTKNPIVWTSETTGVATVNLNASSTYMFKVTDNDGGGQKWYGFSANNYIIQPVALDCGIDNSDIRLFTGPAGNYTFTIDITNAHTGSPYVNIATGYPSVTHPAAGYMYITKWWDCYVHYWEGTSNALTAWGSDPKINSDRYVNICGTDYWYFPVIDTYNKFIAKNKAGDATDSNTTGDQVSTDHGGKYITHSGSWGWHDFSTYTISYNANNGSGSMASHTGICPNGSQTLTSNSFTRNGYSFSGWNTEANGSGTPYADEATISSINANIELFAQWTCVTPTITTNLSTSTVNYNVGDAATALSVAATAAGGSVSYQWYSNTANSTTTPTPTALTTGTSYTPSTAAAGTTYYFCVITNSTAGCSTTATSNITPVTVTAVAVLTAIEADVLYQAQDMANVTLSTDTWFAGLSTNHRFETYGDGSSTSAKGSTISSTNVADDISTKSFTSKLYIMTANNRDNNSDPTKGAIEFITPSTAGVLYIYLEQTNSGLTLKKKGTSTSASLSGANYKVMEVDANTHYFINGSGSNRGLYGIKYVSTYSVAITPTNVTKVTGATGATAAIPGKAYTATFTANTGYTLPSDATVTIGGTPQTKGSGYTWTISDGTATLTIPAANVTGAISITVTGVAAESYSITYHCNGAESGCPSNVVAAYTLPSPLPTGLTKDGYDFGGWFTDSECTVAAVAGAALTGNTDLYAKWTERGSGCEDTPHAWDVIATGAKSYKVRISKVTEEVAIPVADATASNLTAYAGSVSTNDNVTVQIADGGSSQYGYKFDGSNTYLKLVFSTPLVLNDTLVVGMTNASHNISFTTTAVRSTTLSTSGGKLIIPAALAGQSTIYLWRGSGSTMYLRSFAVKHECEAIPSCTTPTLPTSTLSNQTVCEGSDIAAWDATPTNASTITGKSESISYSWKKKGNDTELANTATFDLGSSAAESQAGTYVVTVTVSKTGYASSTATKEVTLSVTDGVEVTAITADKATVYPTNSVTLTATASATATWQWYTCTNAEGDGEYLISEATSASYTIASAGSAGTYYYKVKATGGCGIGSMVYTLTVSAAAGGDCFHYVSVLPDKDISPSSGTNIVTPTYATTLEGGTMKVGSQQITITKNGLKLESSKSVSITLDAALEAGNVVIVKGTSATAGYGVTINGVNFYEADSKTFDVSYTVLADDGLVGKTALTVTKYSGSSYLQEIKITGCGAACTDPEVTASVNNSTACVGSSVTFTATGAHAEATYQWQKYSGGAWTDIASATAATYNIASVATTDALKYRVIATNECDRTSNEVTMNVPVAPVFADFTATRSVMATLALSITDVEASDATSYAWYKSADATYDAGTDTKVGTTQELLLAAGGEAAGATYYLFCVASNACGSTTSGAITVNVTALVEEDCATRGTEGAAEFGFDNTSMSSGTYDSKNVWYKNSNSAYLTYTAPTGKYFKTAKVTIASSNSSNASYQWSTDGSSWTAVTISGLTTTLTEKEINLAAKGSGRVTHFRIGRNLDGAGESSGTFYLHKACFEYTESCTATEVVRSTGSASYDYTYPAAFAKPTFALQKASDHSALVGTLTYSSSNEDIATVDDDGDVDFTGLTGTVTITVAFAGGTISTVDYCASQTTYTITVNCSDVQPKITTSGSSITCQASITLNAVQQSGSAFADGTFQWYRDGVEIEGATSASYTATRAGFYTVSRTATCTKMSSNSANITSDNTEPEVTRLTPFQYYHVDSVYRATSIMRYRHLFTVKGSTAYGSTGKNFKMELSRNGGDAVDVTTQSSIVVTHSADNTVDTVLLDLNALNGKYTENDELVLTCKAIACGGAVSETYKESITVYVINKTKPTLALICSGTDIAAGTRETKKLTVGGDFLTGYNVADLCQQTGNTSFDANTEWGLYTRLKENYIVTSVNGYAVFNKLNYEPFDILLLTDYPKASKSDAAKDVLDDMAALCDYRPMLSFKTHMVAKSPSKWAAKGFTTSPVVTKADGRLNLNIVCYAHPMFASLTEGADVYKDNGDLSQLVYTMLSEPGYESSKGMQGFEIAAAENFVTIGLTHYNGTIAKNSPSTGKVTWTPDDGDRMLVTVAERQTNIEARFILFSLNCGAQSKLTAKGEEVILACLEYLLDDDPLHVADCALTFDNGAGNTTYDAGTYAGSGVKGDGKWSTEANWGPQYLNIPGEFNSARIAAPVTVDLEDAKAMELRIVNEGSINIPAGKGLEVTSTIRRMEGSEIYPTEIGDIHIGSASTGNGTLIFNNNTGDSKAQVDMYSKGFIDYSNPEKPKGIKNYQYIGTPFNEINAVYNYYGSWIYSWADKGGGTWGWQKVPNGGPMYAWIGYCITQETATYYETRGTMTATGAVDIAVPAGKNMVVGNSWTAPISIQDMTTDDFENLTANIYFFNTGVDKNGSGTVNENATGDTRWEGGTYVNIPIASAPYTGSDDHIPSMQGFFVKSNGSAGTLHLDYDKHVRGTTRDNILSGTLHAPKRRTAIDTSEPEVVRIKVSGENYDDKLVLLAREDFSAGFDNGWDGDKWDGNESALYIYTKDSEGTENSVSAIPEMEGTVIGFRAGEDDAYTLHFEYLNGDELLYLFDTENNSYTQIVTGGIYRFFTNDKEKHERFVLTRHAPQIATGCENLDGGEEAKAKKLLIEDKMFIMVNGLLYDATGKVVK